MMRVLLVLAGAAVSTLAWAQEADDPVILEVAGPPIPAEETENPRFFVEPALPAGFPDGSGGGFLAQYWTGFGREDRAYELDAKEYTPTPCESQTIGLEGSDGVLDEIVRQASGTRVVFINESHVNTQHRDFSRQIIERLRPHGFTVFAAEAFRNVDGEADPIERSAELNYPVQADGSYTTEPVFGGLVRAAKRLDFRLAAYEIARLPGATGPENVDESIAEREQAQAQNLSDLLASMADDEKLVVHVGYWHAREIEDVRADGFDVSMMAVRFKRLTGIDPLTIAQTECRGGGDTIQIANPPARIRGAFDLIVDHPTVAFEYGRPSWRFDEAEAIEIPEALRPADSPLIIEAFPAGEPFEATPVDRIWVEPGEDVRLALPAGRYTVRAVRPALADE